MQWLQTIWNQWLGIPAGWIANAFNLPLGNWLWGNGLRLAVLLALLLAIYETWIGLRYLYRKFVKQEDKLLNEPLTVEGKVQDSAFTDSVMAAGNTKAAIAKLKREKRYDRMGEVYAQLNQPRDAAKWFAKAGDKKRAAMEHAKAGNTAKAARLLERVGEYETAGRFYLETKRWRAAAKAFEKANKAPEAADALAKAKRYPQALQAYRNYLETTDDPVARQAEVAAACAALLRNEAATAKTTAEEVNTLKALVAQRFANAERHEEAAALLREAGRPGEAGDLYLKAGKLEAAMHALKEAGRDRDAQLIGARYYAQLGRWKEAGMAFEGGGDMRRAGDCFSKANDPLRAAACYEKGGAYYGAGLALVHAKAWEKAIPMLQQVPEDDPNFDESRNLLGRAFYEMHDYGHCVATLENHLMGQRVRDENINYFWMLALAYEQLGDLEKSRDFLRKIRAVKMGFRDVSARLSNIESRISMVAADGGARTAAGGPTVLGQGQPGMAQAVEDALGKRYSIEAELGRGGMGVVYKAHDTQLDRPVALKFLGSLLDGNEEYRQRFIREARAAAKVSHPNIVSVYDVSPEEGRSYIAMEYVDGPNLHRYLRQKGKLEVREAVSIVGQACAALEAIHRAGIVHRDVKPDNIIIAKGGLVKLMDFGLAKGADNRMTATNVVMGTPCYMSPEQTRGEDVDLRTDIYAMGLVLHEALTGETVFSDGDVLQRQQFETPDPPSAKVPEVPAGIDQIVMKCVAKSPNDRFQTANELLSQLRQAQSAPAS